MQLNNKFFLLIFFLMICCVHAPEKKVMSSKNPTSYSFKGDIREVHKAIITELGDFQFRNMLLCYRGGGMSPLDSMTIFDVSGNENDFYLRPMHLDIGNSCLYEKYRYVVSFHIHLSKIDEQETMVQVNTVNPRIIIGQELLPSGPHLANKYVYLKVEPSTCEEYSILQIIGSGLNQSIPELIKPD